MLVSLRLICIFPLTLIFTMTLCFFKSCTLNNKLNTEFTSGPFRLMLQKKHNELCVLTVTRFVLKYFFQLQLMKAQMFVPFQSQLF